MRGPPQASLQFHCEETHQRTLNLSVALGSSHPPGPALVTFRAGSRGPPAPGRLLALPAGVTRWVQPGGGVTPRAPRPVPGRAHLPPGLLSPSAWSRIPEPRPARAVAHSCPRGPLLWDQPTASSPGPHKAPASPCLCQDAPTSSAACASASRENSPGLGETVSSRSPGTQTPEDRGCGGSRRVGFWELGVKPRTALFS